MRRALALLDAGARVALATVVRASGSVPRHPGALMAVAADGTAVGTIGGGRIEHEVAGVAARVAAGEPAQLVTRHLVRDLAMCCGGTMDVYVEPLAPWRELLGRAVAAVDAGESVVVATSLDSGAKELRARGDEEPRVPRVELAGDGERIFHHPLVSPERVILFGSGHVARAVAPIAASVGFAVVVCDEHRADLDEVPGARWLVESSDPADIEVEIGPLGSSDYAVIVTRDHALDQRILERLLPREDLAYLGMIGSRGKVGRFRKRLEAKGLVTEARWARLHAPIGVDIRAETPEEIAVSVVAELIHARQQRRGEGGG